MAGPSADGAGWQNGNYAPRMTSSADDVYRLGWGEVTIDVLNELISSQIPEGFQLEYKRQLVVRRGFD